MTTRLRSALCLTGLLLAFGCQPATSPAVVPGLATAPVAASGPTVDVGHAGGGAIALSFSLPAPAARRAQAFAADVKTLVLEVKSAALTSGTRGVTQDGVLVVEVVQAGDGHVGATLLNLPATDDNPATRYAVRVKVRDRAGNEVLEGVRPDGFLSVATDLQVDPHHVTVVPTVALPLIRTFALTPVVPTPAPTPKDNPGNGPK
ncbi:hypothetical protein D3C72_665670 [compost metagenome]